MDEKELRRYSRVVVDGDGQAPSRAMLRAVLEAGGVEGIETPDGDEHHALAHAWQTARTGAWRAARFELEKIDLPDDPADSPHRWELAYLRGYVADKLGDSQGARMRAECLLEDLRFPGIIQARPSAVGVHVIHLFGRQRRLGQGGA